MTTTTSRRLGMEFVTISLEGSANGSIQRETRAIFDRIEAELAESGLSLADTVRSRLWGRDRQARDEGSKERISVLSGAARSASSSYIDTAHFSSGARVAVDLVAMRPPPGATKVLQEYEPQIVPLRYLTYGPVTFLSGVTSVEGDLAQQVAEIQESIGGSLASAGVSWADVVTASFYLHRGQQVATVDSVLVSYGQPAVTQTNIAYVEGYSTPGKLIEIEITAQRT